jgi:hypothetical protein
MISHENIMGQEDFVKGRYLVLYFFLLEGEGNVLVLAGRKLDVLN